MSVFIFFLSSAFFFFFFFFFQAEDGIRDADVTGVQTCALPICFLSGWNYWVLYILVGMAELTAVGKYVQYWYPDIPTWATALAFFVLINLINLTNVKAFGEAEFWFAIIKVGAILGMIALGLYLLVSGAGGPQASVTNLWSHGGFFPNGVGGLVVVMAVIMFSFGGLELVGITAAEAENPRKVIPRAINQVVYRLLLFYILALGVLLSLYPWDSLVQTLTSGDDPYARSPFVQIFSLIGSDTAAHVLNFVVLTAALSVYNSGVYCNSRMLYGLAEQGDAPRVFTRLSRSGVPVMGILISGLITLLCVALNYVLPEGALIILMSLVVAALVLNWAMISLSHLMFRRSMQQQGVTPTFRALWSPFGNWLCLAFVGFILVVLLLDSSTRLSVFALPVWVMVIGICYLLKRRAA